MEMILSCSTGCAPPTVEDWTRLTKFHPDEIPMTARAWNMTGECVAFCAGSRSLFVVARFLFWMMRNDWTMMIHFPQPGPLMYPNLPQTPTISNFPSLSSSGPRPDLPHSFCPQLCLLLPHSFQRWWQFGRPARSSPKKQSVA